MDAHSDGSRTDVLRYHVTTRNFFAVLLRKPLVGFTFYQALVDLHERLHKYLPPTVDSTVALQSYLIALGLVNVSNEPRAAAGLLAWSEEVRWNSGWREGYVIFPSHPFQYRFSIAESIFHFCTSSRRVAKSV